MMCCDLSFQRVQPLRIVFDLPHFIRIGLRRAAAGRVRRVSFDKEIDLIDANVVITARADEIRLRMHPGRQLVTAPEPDGQIVRITCVAGCAIGWRRVVVTQSKYAFELGLRPADRRRQMIDTDIPEPGFERMGLERGAAVDGKRGGRATDRSGSTRQQCITMLY